MMKVSIITTCWNRAATVGNAIRSIMDQSYPEIEHVVVDGASTDDSLQVIRSCGSRRIATLISEPDHGCYEALNKGIKAATGDIVGWLHSDDVMSNNDVIAKVVSCFEQYGCDMVYANGRFVSPADRTHVIREWIGGLYSDRKIKNGWLPLHTTVYVRRDIFERFSYYREDYRISGDTQWLLSCMYRTGIKIHYMDECVVEMNMGGLSTSWKRTVNHWREDIRAYRSVGIHPYWALSMKVLRKVPQFIKAKLGIKSR